LASATAANVNGAVALPAGFGSATAMAPAATTTAARNVRAHGAREGKQDKEGLPARNEPAQTAQQGQPRQFCELWTGSTTQSDFLRNCTIRLTASETPAELPRPHHVSIVEGMDGTPVGRRVFLGLAAFGVSGILWGSKAANLMERLLGPVSVKDGSGLLGLLPTGRFRIYSVTNTLPSRAPADWELEVDEDS